MAADWTVLLEAVQNILSRSTAMGAGQLGANEPTLAELTANRRCRPFPDIRLAYEIETPSKQRLSTMRLLASYDSLNYTAGTTPRASTNVVYYRTRLKRQIMAANPDNKRSKALGSGAERMAAFWSAALTPSEYVIVRSTG
jgi:hypothetical protein